MRTKTRLCLLAALPALAVVSTACHGKDGDDPTVYVTGQDGNWATLWKNGAVAYQSYSKWAGFESVFVAGDDVYIAGADSNDYERDHATIWKNGVATRLSDLHSVANSVHVSDGNVYIAGTVVDADAEDSIYQYRRYATLWVNGVATRLNGSTDSYGESVYVHGGDVYVAGTVDNGAYPYFGNAYRATFWKNGEATRLSDYLTVANSVHVSDGDVYVAGSDPFGACLWKNGDATYLFDDSPDAVFTKKYSGYSVFVSGGDAYVAGIEFAPNNIGNRGMVWKNGALLRFGSDYASAWSVFVSGSGVYIAGQESVNGTNRPTLWMTNPLLKGVTTTHYAVDPNSFRSGGGANSVFVK